MSTRKGATPEPRVTYLPREDATLESELAAIAAVYGFVLGRYEQVRAPVGVARSGEGDEEPSNMQGGA